MRKIGAGGMGIVYLATDTETDHSVALKILSRKKAANPALVKRFESEAQAAAGLKHDHITAVYEAGQIDGFLYIALEYVEGTDVQRLVNQEGRLSPERSLEIVRQVALALQHAFEVGIVHRDIKPSNLLIDNKGNVQLTDMGLARSVDESAEAGLTRVGTTVGTVDYMAPEQAQDSRSADIRSDIYSLGCTWYHMLTGSPPFPDGTLTNKLFAHQSNPRPDPREKNPDVTAAVASVVRKTMAISQQDRYQTPGDLLEDLDRLAEGRDPSSLDVSGKRSGVGDSRVSRSGSLPSAARRSRSRSRDSAVPENLVKVISLVVAAVLLVGVGIWASTFFLSEPDAPESESLVGNGPPKNGSDPFPIPDEIDPVEPVQKGKGSETEQNPQPPDVDPLPEEEGVLPNPGNAAGIEIGRAEDREHMPPWVAGVWPAGDGNTQLPVITVGRNDGEPSDFANLSSALLEVPPTGGIVRLVGNGPFLLTPTSLVDRSRVVITSSEGNRPLILLVPGRSAQDETILRVSNGSLVFDSVHLAAAGEMFRPKGRLALVQVHSGNLTFRNSTLTLHGKRPGETIGLRFTGTATLNREENGSRSQVLLDRSYFHGEGLSAIAIDQPGTDLVASHCVFAGSNAPIMKLNDSASRNGSSAAAQQASRRLGIFSCTVVADELAIEFSSAVGLTPHRTVLNSRNSVFAAVHAAGSPTLLTLNSWPAASVQHSNRSSVKNLLWKTDTCLFLGWKDLITTKPSTFVPVQGPSGWQRFWGQLVQSNQFQPQVWPGKRLNNIAYLSPRYFDSSSIPQSPVTTSDGSVPGCVVNELTNPEPAGNTVKRAVALADRARLLPESFQKLPVDNRVNVDLSKNQDLGRIISITKWPDHTLFVVTGSGTHTSSEIRVQDKSLRIRFEPDQGESLVIRPKQLSSRDLNSGDDSAGAFISISNGSLEIENGSFQVPNSTSRSFVKWFLFVRNGDFSLENTLLEGPMLDNPGYRGLIRWARSNGTTTPSLNSARRYEGTGRILNSYLATSKSLISADIRRRALVCENSVLVALETLCDLDLIGNDSRHDACVDLEGCTVSSGSRIFDVDSSSRSGIGVEPLRFYVSRTVFAPPVKSTMRNEGDPTLLITPDNALQRQELTWWGNANGYAEELTSFVQTRSDSRVSAQEIRTEWLGIWSPERIDRPLFGRGRVSLKSFYPDPLKLTASSFRLDDACDAARWTEDGQPIGADIYLVLQRGKRDGGSSE